MADSNNDIKYGRNKNKIYEGQRGVFGISMGNLHAGNMS